MGIGCPKRPDGSKVDIVCADSRSALSVFVERASPGTKGYLSMFRNAGLLSSWVDFAPTSGGESGAADTYAQVYAGYATHRNKGHWEDIRFRRDRTCSEPRMPTQVGNPLIPPLAAIHTQSVRANNHRGSINSTSLTSRGRTTYQCYAISVAQALFCCREFAQYLENHARRHSAARVATTEFRSPRSCYVCSLPHAYIYLSSDHVGPLAPNEHGLWSGDAWSNVGPILRGESIRNMPPSDRHHAAAEYVATTISYIGRMEAHLASFLAHKTASCRLEDGPHGCPYLQCASCGGAPLAVRPPITSLPWGCEVSESVSELRNQDNALQRQLLENTADRIALSRNSSICDAPLDRRNNGEPNGPCDSICVVAHSGGGYGKGGYL